MELKTIKLEPAGPGVAVLTLDRPASLNAWTGRMHTELRWAMERAEEDDDTRVVIITGEGRGFCSGADMAALAGHSERGGYDPGTPEDLARPGYGVSSAFDADFAWLLGLDTTVVAAVNGPAAGVGLVLACWCDLRFVWSGAKLTTAHGRLNLPPEFGLSWLLPRLVGRTHANDLLLSSRVFDGSEAARMGLANRVLDEADQVLPAALGYAAELVRSVSPASLATTKRRLSLDLLHNDPATSVEVAGRQLEEMMRQPDYSEGVAAFSQRRDPDWTQAPRSVQGA